MEETTLLGEHADVMSDSTPPKNFVVRNKRKFAAFTVVIVVVVLSLFDVWYGLVHNSNLRVDSAEVSLESNAQSDATLTVNGKLATKSFLHSLSIDDTYCSMQYSNSGDASASWQDLARVQGVVSTKSNSGFELSVALQEVSYSPLRHLLSDAYWNSPTGLSVQCHAGVKLYLYHAIPVHLYTDLEVTITTPTPDAIKVHYSSSGISNTGAFKFSSDAELLREDGDEKGLKVAPMLRYLQKILRPVSKWISKHLRSVYDNQAAGLHGHFKNPFDTTEYVNSFIVKVPELSVATTLLGDKENGGRYHLSSTAFQVQLSQEKLALDVDFTLLCSDAFDPASPVTELHSCNLLDSQGGKALWDTLNAGLVSVAMDSASNRNFLSELAGTHHSLIGETVDMADVEAKITKLLEEEQNTDASVSNVHPNFNNLIGDELITIQDPRISTGGKCVAGSADNIYDTYTCAIVESGFFKVYLYIFDSDGLITKIQILTSWAPSAPFAAATQAVVVARGGYAGEWNSTISELFQNATLSVLYEENMLPTFRSEALAKWDLKHPSESGMVDFIGYLESTVDRADMSTGLTYGDNAYSTYFSAEYNSTEAAVSGVKLNANGGYGGNYYNWWLGVDNADIFVDGQKQGDANSYLSSTVSTTGDAADFTFQLTAKDGNEVQQLNTENTISWSSPDEFWSTSGLIKVDSVLDILGSINWNADAALNYADEAYNFVVRDLTIDETSEIFLTQGNGNYGGGWTNWWADLVESSVIINDGLVGNATGAISAAVSSTGESGVLTFITQATDANAVEQLYTSNNATWSSSSFWTAAGALAANSAFRLINSVTWNTHADFTYGDNAYVGKATDVDSSGVEQFLVSGLGGYGGSWTHWWASLDSSELYVTDAKIGSAVGEVISRVDVDGLNGWVSLTGAVSDAGDSQILNTVESVEWYSRNWDWLQSGRIDAVSQFNYPSFAYWNTTGNFDYGENAYSVNATDMSANYEDKVFDLFAGGKYGGNWNNWYASLTDSFVFLEGSKVGSITGEIDSAVSSDGQTGSLSFNTLINDGNDINWVKTVDTLAWFSDAANWLDKGEVTVSSLFYLADSSVQWKADGDFNYHYGQYQLFLEDYQLDNTQVFKAEADGAYGGSWTDFFATVSYGVLQISGEVYGTLVGNFGAAVSATGDAADIVLYALVNDGNSNEQLYTNSTIAWSSSSAWTDAGHMAASSGFRLINSLSFDANGFLEYADSHYSLLVQEKQLDGFVDFLVKGVGFYGGNWNEFWASLAESSLVVSDSLLGTATGNFYSAVTSNFDTGLVYFSALAFDSSEVPVLELSTNNTVVWASPIYDWITQGNITVASATQVADIVDWDAVTQFLFNNGDYSLTIADNDLDGSSVFLTQGAGTYGGTYGDWFLTVDESVCYIYDTKQGQAEGKLSWLNVGWFNIATLKADANVTDGNNQPLLHTTNLLTWYNLGYYEGYDNIAQGVIYTNTDVNDESAFVLFSNFLLNQDGHNATFTVVETLGGEMGLSATAKAFYDEEFGMVTGIDTKVSYASELLFEAHTSWDAQLETADFNPTATPTETPSNEPTAAPTDAPSDAPSDVPTEAPTADPTVKPGEPTAYPTATPTAPTPVPTTARPSVAPSSGKPSIAPSTGPTRTPTRTPTRAPTVVPTTQTSPILVFTSNVTLAGVTGSTLDYNSQQAVVSVTASSMNLPSSTVFFLSSHSIASSGRRFLKSHKSLFVTTYTVVADMKVSVPLSSTTSSSTTALYQSLTNQLNTAVSSGTYSTNLQQVSTSMGATQTATASATGVSNSQPESVDPASSSSSNNGLSGGAIAGIVIGVIAGVAIIIALIWYFVVQGGSPGAADNFAPGGARAASTTSGASSGSRSPKKGDTSQDKVFSTENPLSSKKHANVGDENL